MLNATQTIAGIIALPRFKTVNNHVHKRASSETAIFTSPPGIEGVSHARANLLLTITVQTKRMRRDMASKEN